MRLNYKVPKELASALKDLIDSYLDDLIDYDKLKERLIKLVEANEDRIYKDGIMSLKISNVLGESRVEIVNKIMDK
ncbi:TIGR04540 family protein [Clostridium sp.]|uniref:TIGR04540 family protein n=1 Tax=Clostridium sp. TaxID=1506 RepID=UPI002FC98106